VLKVKQSNADALFIYTNEEESARALRELRKQGYDKPIIGESTLTNEKVVELAGDAANGVVAWTSLNFEAMTGYQDFTNSSTTFSVSVAGSSTPFLEQTYLPAGEANYTLVVYGTISAPSLAVISDVTQPPPSGQSTLSFYDAAPVGNGSAVGLYPIDIYVTSPGQALDNISPTFTTVQYTNGNTASEIGGVTQPPC
jgi:hypothetical protein